MKSIALLIVFWTLIVSNIALSQTSRSQLYDQGTLVTMGTIADEIQFESNPEYDLISLMINDSLFVIKDTIIKPLAGPLLNDDYYVNTGEMIVWNQDSILTFYNGVNTSTLSSSLNKVPNESWVNKNQILWSENLKLILFRGDSITILNDSIDHEFIGITDMGAFGTVNHDTATHIYFYKFEGEVDTLEIRGIIEEWKSSSEGISFTAITIDSTEYGNYRISKTYTYQKDSLSQIHERQDDSSFTYDVTLVEMKGEKTIVQTKANNWNISGNRIELFANDSLLYSYGSSSNGSEFSGTTLTDNMWLLNDYLIIQINHWNDSDDYTSYINTKMINLKTGESKALKTSKDYDIGKYLISTSLAQLFVHYQSNALPMNEHHNQRLGQIQDSTLIWISENQEGSYDLKFKTLTEVDEDMIQQNVELRLIPESIEVKLSEVRDNFIVKLESSDGREVHFIKQDEGRFIIRNDGRLLASESLYKILETTKYQVGFRCSLFDDEVNGLHYPTTKRLELTLIPIPVLSSKIIDIQNPYPNPNNGIFKLESLKTHHPIIYDPQGREIPYEMNQTSDGAIVDFQNQKNGLYYLYIPETGATFKLIKKE